MPNREKAVETRRRHAEQERAERAALLNDRSAAIQLCRQVRDDPDADNADRLRAVELLRDLTGGGL